MCSDFWFRHLRPITCVGHVLLMVLEWSAGRQAERSTINRHRHPVRVPMFVRYPHHRLRSVLSATIWAMEFHPRHRTRFAQWAAIRGMNLHPPHQSRSAPSAANCVGTLKKTKQSRSLRWLQIQVRNGSNWKNKLDKSLKIEFHWQNILEVETYSSYRRERYRRS
jgi:hypothetical protein